MPENIIFLIWMTSFAKEWNCSIILCGEGEWQ